MTTRLQMLASESQALKALMGLFCNRMVGLGALLGALLGGLGFVLTGESLGPQLPLLMLVGLNWGVVGAVVYVGFLQDLEITLPSLAWFDRYEWVDHEGLEMEVEPEPIEEAPPPPPPPSARRRPAATTASRPAPAPAQTAAPAAAEAAESAHDAELITG